MKRLLVLLITFGLATQTVAAKEAIPDYNREIAPILRQYCAGCHNSEDREGGFSVETFAAIGKGGKTGPALTPGSPESSRMIGMLTGKIEPAMPPEGTDAPQDAEIQKLMAWIKAGAKGPSGVEPDRTQLQVPKIPSRVTQPPGVTAVAWSPDGKMQALGRFGQVTLVHLNENKAVRTLTGFAGKVNSLQFTKDSQHLLVGGGVAGLYGKAVLVDVKTEKTVASFQGHRDAMYAAILSPDGRQVATASYDKNIWLWDVSSGKPLRKLSGHNGAVYDLAFSPDGKLLASASGDETGKIWSVDSGQRLDTLSQPQGEQFAIAFHPRGREVVAAGADNRIRVWQVVSRTSEKINPLLHARFAHEGGIVALAFSTDGRWLATASEDRVVKLWETGGYTEWHAWENQPDISEAIAFSPDGTQLLLGRMNGEVETLTIPKGKQVRSKTETGVIPKLVAAPATMHERQEAEPNDTPQTAMSLSLPAQVTGVILPPQASDPSAEDVDLYRFRAKAGEQWVMETMAARAKSPLDSKLEVLDASGKRIVRVLLQAQRDSYFTFRGKDSNTSDDFRVHNWREMELNDYLYAGGEVVRLWLYPRGPDSGFKVYPGRGKRHTMFDTPALSHALGEPCYIVKPLSPSETIVPNGLPVFPVYYENDDDSRRKLGADSQLYFTAPKDGEYLVRVSDVRGFSGKEFKYTLTVRPRKPDFRVRLIGANPKVPPGSGREFRVEAERLDHFAGPITVTIDHLPPGFHVTSPLVIQAGQDQAFGVIWADADAKPPAEDIAKATKVTAEAVIASKPVSRDVNNLGTIQLDKPNSLQVRLEPADRQQSFDPSRPLELTLAPGETVTARVVVTRNGHQGNVTFGKEDAGRNLPFGTFVDNIGLNGLLILPGQNERLFFITASPIAEETTRVFHLRCTEAGGHATKPAIIHIRRSDARAAQGE